MNYSRTFQVGKKENERYNLYSIKSKTISMSMIVFIAVSVLVTLVQLKSYHAILYALLIGTGLGLAGVIFFITFNIALIKYRIHNSYKSGRIRPFIQHILMNESGIHARTEQGSVDVPFDLIGGVEETKQAYYICIDAGHTYVFPKDQMKGEKEYQKVRKVFRANMPAGKLRLKT